jgi:hypothetical protein
MRVKSISPLQGRSSSGTRLQGRSCGTCLANIIKKFQEIVTPTLSSPIKGEKKDGGFTLGTN